MSRTQNLPDFTEARVQDLVGLIYDAALDQERLPEVLEAIADATRSHKGAIFMQELSGQHGHVLSAYEVDPALLISYDTHYSHENLFMIRSEPDLHSGAVIPGHKYVADDELRKSVYFNEYFRELDVFYNVGCCIFREDDFTAMLTLLRKTGESPFGDQ